jgi:NAD+ synthase
MTRAIKDSFKLALAQLNPVAGDIEGNVKKAREARARAAREGADLIAFTELYLTGYPIEDLVLKPALQAAAREACEALARDTGDGGPGMLVGLPWGEAPFVYNAVALLDRGRIEAVRYKYNLPNYGVFDEKRVFAAGPLPQPIEFRGLKLGVPVCEDVWSEEVCEALALEGADLLIVPNGSPYWIDKQEVRYGVAETRVAETRLPLAYVNQVGGQDELVFDGASFVLNADTSLAVQLPAWEEALGLTEWRREEERWHCLPGQIVEVEEDEAANYLACVTGLRDYVEKNGFPGVVLGLSGGVDSALCAAMAVDALGPARVYGVMLSYIYTSNESLDDAAATAEALRIRYDIMPVYAAVEGLSKSLEQAFEGTKPDAAEENLQSRARGTLLMALSNKFGSIVLTTGNKSEVSVGYATLYGDMNGGFNPIKDLYKGQVYTLARYRNRACPKGCLGPEGIVIPENVLTKAPTAELKPGQRDQDTLPPYEVLDDILNCLVELEMPLPEIAARGHAPELVKKVERMLYLAEYKRRQAAPGVKITAKNFGRDRRYPITNKFREKL